MSRRLPDLTPRLVVLIGLALVAVACSGGDSTAALPETTSTETSAGASAATAAATGSDRSYLDIVTELDGLRAERLVGLLGDEGGLDALLLAWERGYSGDQLDQGIVAGTLRTDGSIDEVAPEGAPLGLIELPEAESEARDLRESSAPLLVAYVSQSSGGASDPLPIEKIRELARTLVGAWGGDDRDASELLGLDVISQLLILRDHGYSPQQIIEAIILGADLTYEDTKSDVVEGRVETCALIKDLDGVFVTPARGRPSHCVGLVAELNGGGDTLADGGDATQEPAADGAETPDEAPGGKVYEQDFGGGSGLISVSVLPDSSNAVIEVVVNAFGAYPADNSGPACRTDTPYVAQATVPATADRIDATFTGTYTVRAGTCGDRVIGLGEEEATFTVSLELGARSAEGTLTIANPSNQLFGLPPLVLPIAATVVDGS